MRMAITQDNVMGDNVTAEEIDAQVMQAKLQERYDANKHHQQTTMSWIDALYWAQEWKWLAVRLLQELERRNSK